MIGPSQVEETYKQIITKRCEMCFHREILKLYWELMGELGMGTAPQRRGLLWAGALRRNKELPVWPEEHRRDFLFQGHNMNCGTTGHPASFTPSLSFPQNSRHFRKIPFLSCSHLHSKPKVELKPCIKTQYGFPSHGGQRASRLY